MLVSSGHASTSIQKPPQQKRSCTAYAMRECPKMLTFLPLWVKYGSTSEIGLEVIGVVGTTMVDTL